MSPTNSVSPVSSAQGSGERDESTRAKAVCSGLCPGVWIASMLIAPSSSVQPSSNGSCS